MATMTVHSGLFSQLSEPFRALMTGAMRESEERVAELPDVEPNVFIALYEFASTGDYSAPPPDPNDEHRYLRTNLEECDDLSGEQCGQEQEQAVDSVTTDTEKDNPQCLDEGRCESLAPGAEASFVDDLHPYWGYSRKNKQLKNGCFICGHHTATQADISQTTKLWRQFQELHFPRSHFERAHPSSRPNVMFHAKLYCLAEEKMIEPLKQCCLGHLHSDLLRFELTIETIQEVLNLACFTYTMRSRQSSNGEDGLRKLVSYYIASQTQIFQVNKYFRAVLDANGELGSDLVYLLLN